MKAITILMTSLLALPTAGYSNTDAHEVSVMKANIQYLQKENQTLQQQKSALEKRISDLENKLPDLVSSISKAQQSADSAQTSANKAQSTASQAHSSYTSVSHGHLRGFHEQCFPSTSNSPGCFAAARRYCNSIGFSAGLIQEVGGSDFGVACFR
jgi:regulator of replication initiation timing